MNNTTLVDVDLLLPLPGCTQHLHLHCAIRVRFDRPVLICAAAIRA